MGLMSEGMMAGHLLQNNCYLEWHIIGDPTFCFAQEAGSNNVNAIFASEEYSVKVAQAISNETNAKVYILNSVVAGKTDKNSYIDIMEENLQTLILALN